MKFIKILCILFSFGLYACASSNDIITNQQVYEVGKELKRTNKCLARSHVEDLRLSSRTREMPPNIGIFKQLSSLKMRTVIYSIIGKDADLSKHDVTYFVNGYNENFNDLFYKGDCKPYLDFYEAEYYKLKTKGY